VHASLAEFDLAFKAFDSYVEIVTRGKERAEKSGQAEDVLDDDSTILRTASEAIRILCRYGSREQGEKARDIGTTIENWLQQHTPAARSDDANREEPQDVTEDVVPNNAQATAYCAVGISKAHWARLTYHADSRANLQAEAVAAFRKALDCGSRESKNLETMYSLGLLLAEMRDISSALKVIKQALAIASEASASHGPDVVLSGMEQEGPVHDGTQQKRKLLPVWHLLILLLTARSDLSTATQLCTATFEEFLDPQILYGLGASASMANNDFVNESEKSSSANSRGLIDHMESFEKEGLIQLKLTQLSLIEALDGPAAAVDRCGELLELFNRAFGNPYQNRSERTKTEPSRPSRSAQGTIKGSLFSRSRLSRKGNGSPAARTQRASGAPNSRPASTGTAFTTNGPTIEVTGADGALNTRTNGHHRSLLGHHKRDQESDTADRRSIGSMKKKAASALPGYHNKDPRLSSEKPALPDETNGTESSEKQDLQVPSAAPVLVQSLVERPQQELRSIAHNKDQTEEPPPLGHPYQPPKQDVRLPAPIHSSDNLSMEPRFPSLQERRYRVSLLVQVWLFIARLYIRTSAFEDAKGAIDEGFKLVNELELEVSSLSSSSKAFAESEWGGGRSIERLWADVYAEVDLCSRCPQYQSANTQQRAYLAQACCAPHEALSYYEKSLFHFPDHPSATVGISELLLEIYSQNIPAEPPQPVHMSLAPSTSAPSSNGTIAPLSDQAKSTSLGPSTIESKLPNNPEELNRLAARDRAYQLLSTLTKLGSGWDYSEAWYALARTHEEGGQIEKAKEVLWWCVELEDTRPLREWHSVGTGGYVL